MSAQINTEKCVGLYSHKQVGNPMSKELCPGRNIFLNSDSLKGTKVYIQGDYFHYLKHVRRVSKGSMLNAVIGRRKYLLLISKIGRKDILCDIVENHSTQCEQSVSIRVYQGLLKSRKMDFVVSKLSELGVEALFPIKTERTVPAIHTGNEKMKRCMKIAAEGSKISGSERVMKIHEPREFHLILIQLKRENAEKLLIFSTDPLNPHIKKVLDSIDYSQDMKFHLFFGPEGGLTENEVISLTGLKGLPVSLGPFVLKSETAAIMGAGFIRIFYEGK